MKNPFKKLKSRRGETLMEAMVGILVFTLSSLMMYTMVTTAADLNFSARQADLEHQKQMVVAEQAQGTAQETTVTMRLTQDGKGARSDTLGSPKVKVYGKKGESLVAYYLKPR